MRKTMLVGAVGSVLVLAALLLALTASAAKGTRAISTKSCYPNNQFIDVANDTSVTWENAKTKAEGEYEASLNTKSVDATGVVKVNGFLDVSGDVLTGYVTAELTFTKTKDPSKSYRVTFESNCVDEVGTEEDDIESPEEGGPDFAISDQFEAEFEGTVTGLPWSKKAQKAVLSISGYRNDDTGDRTLKVGVEQGKTCNETGGEVGLSNQEVGDLTGGDFFADDTEAAYVELPAGKDFGNCPDVGF